MPDIPTPVVVIVMGVSGSGKTTVGKALAQRLGWAFQEGDDLHPAANLAKMTAGAPLTDADRAPWLAQVKAWIDGRLAAGRSGVVSCSALKRGYRETLVAGRSEVRIAYLKGAAELIDERLSLRQGHFMPPALLASQFADLEPPQADERAIEVDIRGSVGEQADRVVEALGET